MDDRDHYDSRYVYDHDYNRNYFNRQLEFKHPKLWPTVLKPVVTCFDFCLNCRPMADNLPKVLLQIIMFDYLNFCQSKNHCLLDHCLTKVVDNVYDHDSGDGGDDHNDDDNNGYKCRLELYAHLDNDDSLSL